MGRYFTTSWLRLHFSELIGLHRSQKQLHFRLLHDLSPRQILSYLGSNPGWTAASKCLWITWEIRVLCDTVLGPTGCFPANKLNGAKELSLGPNLSSVAALPGWSFLLICCRDELPFACSGSHDSVSLWKSSTWSTLDSLTMIFSRTISSGTFLAFPNWSYAIF